MTMSSYGSSRKRVRFSHKCINSVFALLLLTIISNISNEAHAASPNSTSIPFSVGQCWQVNVAKNVPSLFWNGTGPVNCSKPHNGYTYAVIILPMNYPDPYNDKKSARDQAIVDSFNLKNPDPLAAVMANNRSRGASYFPTKLQWLAGQRWERFDLGIAQFGSPVAPFNKVIWANLPADIMLIISELKNGLPEFKFCTNAPTLGDLPDGDSATFADCRANPMHRFPFASGPYSVGQCWKVDESKNLPSNFWNGSAPISCEKSHNAYTYGVWSLTKDIKSLPVRGSTVDNSIRDGCTNQTPLANRNNRTTTIVYYPSPKQWASGVRTYRCDLGLVQFGSSFSKPKWAPLPPNAQTVIDGLKKNSLEYRICSNTFKTGDSPTGASAVWANCTGNPMHRYLGAKNIAINASEKFPGAKVANIRANNYCKSLTKNSDSYIGQYSSAVGWTSGQGFAWCWQEISPPVAPASAADPYSVGECWNLDQSKNLTSNYWNGSAPVSCEKSHNAYTYGVWSLTKDIKSLPVRGSTVDNSIRDGCTYQTPLSLPNNRITTVVYYPSPKQWDSSVRTYRCDVGLYQFGSLYFNPKWTQLPSDIKRMLNDITKKSPLYQLCFITSVPDVLPTNDPKAVFANCLGKYSYRYLGAVNLKKKANESYPGGGVLSDEGSSACRALAPKNGSTSFQEIDKRMWESGNTWVYCWQVS